jgi:hypothetical protein
MATREKVKCAGTLVVIFESNVSSTFSSRIWASDIRMNRHQNRYPYLFSLPKGIPEAAKECFWLLSQDQNIFVQLEMVPGSGSSNNVSMFEGAGVPFRTK